MSLLAIGTIAFDSIETPTDIRHRILGGSATYFSYAASFFAPVRLVGIVGKDWPESYSQLLAERGIDLTGLVRDPDRNTYFWHGRYSLDLQDRATLACEVQGFDQITPEVPTQFRDSRFVFLGAASPIVQRKTLSQCRKPEFVVADTVDMWIEKSQTELRLLLQQVDCLLINESEVRQFTGVQNLVLAGKKIQAMGPRMVIVKKGEHGCLFFSEQSVIPCPAYPTEKIVDPTGAGDSFAGGMIGYLVSRPAIDPATMVKAIQYGTVVASFTVGGFSLDGLQQIQLSDIETRRSHFREMLSVD